MHGESSIIVLAVAVIGIGAGLSEVQTVREPVLDGKRLSVWLKDYEESIPGPGHDGNPQLGIRAATAVRGIGTNGLAWLLQELSAKEATRGNELPTNYTSGEAIKRRWLAASAFQILGSSAKDAAPNVIRLLDDNLPAVQFGII